MAVRPIVILGDPDNLGSNLGKLLSALSWVFLLLLASIPVTALVFTFGGVGPEDVIRAYAVLVGTAIVFGTIGLFVSALVKRTQAATVINLVTLLALTVGTLKEYALGEPTWGCPSRLNRIRSIALTSVAVPTVERALAPIRSWSTTIAVVSPSRTSTSGRACVGMKPCTKAL